MKASKVCLINPPTTDPSERSVYFPMALLTLGGVLKAKGVAAELWDFDLYFKKAGNISEKDFRKLLKSGVKGAGTAVFGISSICSNFPMALYIAKLIKEFEPGSLIIFGGPQPSSIPGEILERFPFVDCVVAGEGERTLAEMVECGFRLDAFREVPGLWYRDDGRIQSNAKRALVENMDDLPFPDYALVNIWDYAEFQGGGYSPCIEVGRGCPFHCTFCSTSLMWEKDFRVKSPARIFQEMKRLNETFGFASFDFIHDNFTTSRKFVTDFCEYLENHSEPQYTWTASSRTDCIDVKRLQRMYRVGLRGLFFGIETGSARMQAVIKKNLNFENFEPILQEGNRIGMSSTTAFIMGFPEEGEEDLDQTFLRALHYKRVGTNRVFFSKLAALTGTGLYREFVGRMKEVSHTSTINPQNYGIPYICGLIERYPDLFSSFFHVPHPKFSSDYLVKFVEFSNLAVNGSPRLVAQVLDILRLSPTRLFHEWNGWSESRGKSYWNYRVYSVEDFRADFQSFLDERYFSRIKHPESVRPFEILPSKASRAVA
ncbi:MAG: radical SAM protein [Deltaproteobacteria bacterium]|nr:radical SAM protein [Deltaproteobacteria bacterium]